MEIKLDDRLTTEQLVTTFEVLIELAKIGKTMEDFRENCRIMSETKKVLDKMVPMDVTNIAEAYQEAAHLLKEQINDEATGSEKT